MEKMFVFFGPTRSIAAVSMLAVMVLAGCGQQGGPPAPPAPEVSVIKLAPTSITVFEDYAAQTEAVDTVEIRARVGGILERQAYVDGASVKKDDLLFLIDQQPYIAALEQAKGNLAQAQASLQNSKQNLARSEPLLQDQAISQQDYDAALAKERSDTANVEALRAQVRQAELNLAYTTIRAPRDGVVSKAQIRPGGLVNASTTLLTTLYSVDPLHVNFVVGEQKLLELRQLLGRQGKGADAAFRIKLIDGSDYPQPGKLDFVDAAVDPKNGTLQVRISVPNPERALRPGQFVRVVMPARERANAIRVPQRAVTELLGTQSVFVVGAEDKAVSKQIVAKTRIGNDWVVDQGLESGELVIVDGISKVRAGSPVKPVVVSADAAEAGKAQQQTAPQTATQPAKK
jgi:membrane fusion protein (multidrug efflux system)